MKVFAVSISIRARPEAIWALLTDAQGFSSWNSTVESVLGQIALGSRITVRARATPGQAFPVKVSEFVPPSRMVWSGGMPLGLFSGRRTFTLEPQEQGHVRFDMREEFTGLLAPLISRSIPDLRPSFDRFAADLKQRAESVTRCCRGSR